MSDDNMNGNADPVVAAAIAGNIPTVPVHPGVVQALSDALERARRGEIHAVVMAFARGTDFASGDVVVVDSMALAMILSGAIEVAQAKITQGARDAQQQMQGGPTSKIIRPGAGRG